MSLALLCGVALLAAVGCGGAEDGDGEKNTVQPSAATFDGQYPIKIVCTTGMVADMIAAVGGENVQVERLMGEGVDPHIYEPTMKDNTLLARGDMVFYNGLHLEPKMHDVFVAMSKKKPVFAIGDFLKEAHAEKLIALEGDLFDPHIWFDPELWSACVPGVIETLSKFDSTNADAYASRGEAYKQKILELVQYGRDRINEVPTPRYLVTAHDAFSYFGRAFDVNVSAIQGVSTEAEASVGRFSELVDLMVENKIKAVFAESSINSKNVEALLEGCKAKNHEVKLGGELYSDALGPENSEAGEYLGMVRHNIDTIAEALK
ncbi:MAG: metal ABC transporter solute-binding protein, Zn/Mn family [Planctomycetaceae bacterium]